MAATKRAKPARHIYRRPEGRIAGERKGKRADVLVTDPCPICGVAQATHWRCARCTSRGHILGHSDPASPYCDDCAAELARTEHPTTAKEYVDV